MSYTVKRVDGSGASLDNFRFRPTVQFQVVHDDGKVAWSGSSYFAEAGARAIAGLRMNASKMCKRYEAYLKRTGERFEIIEEAKLKAQREAKKRADRIAYLQKNLPLWQAELAELTKEPGT